MPPAPKTKPCTHCGQPMHRKRGLTSYTETKPQWLRRKYCNRACKDASQRKTRTPPPEPPHHQHDNPRDTLRDAINYHPYLLTAILNPTTAGDTTTTTYRDGFLYGEGAREHG